MPSELRRTENEFILQNRNEVLAEKVKEIAPGVSGEEIILCFKCECSELICGETVTLKINEYQRITKQLDRFILFPLHEQLDIEAIIERTPEYIVVEKRWDLVAKVV